MTDKDRNKCWCFAVGILLLLASFQEADPFSALLKQHQIGFQLPAGYSKTNSDNKLLRTQRTITSADKRVEVRYLITDVPADSIPENYFRSSFQNMILLLTGGRKSKVVAFTSEAVRKDFNADIGASSLITPHPSFGGSYAKCMVLCVQKNYRSQVFAFILMKDTDHLQQYVEPGFYAIKFLN